MWHLACAGIVWLSACAGRYDGSTGPITGLTSGTFAATVATTATDSSQTFSLASGGVATVGICGPVSSNFDLEIAGQRSSTASNCEFVTFTTVAATTYRVRVIAVSGSGAFNGCWVAGSTACDVPTPVGMACTGAVPPDTATGIPANYYASARNKCGPELLTALTAIVSTQRVLGYTSARDSLYAYIDDLDDDDVIEDIYTGRRAPNVNSRATAFTAKLNAEHAWPQSRGAAEDPAMSDLNHLFAADSTANVTRLNYPFGVITGTVAYQSTNPPTPGDVSRLGFDATGQLVFEPRPSRRGDVARALLYFYTRYNTHRTASFSLTNWTRERAILLQWSDDDPVSAAERTRNNLVYRAQLNRNPYIDWPPFVKAVGGW